MRQIVLQPQHGLAGVVQHRLGGVPLRLQLLAGSLVTRIGRINRLLCSLLRCRKTLACGLQLLSKLPYQIVCGLNIGIQGCNALSAGFHLLARLHKLCTLFGLAGLVEQNAQGFNQR
ncbi:hypothetical protein D3C86_1553080 [compost metagenome]